jgi:hypothetical protein
MRLDDQCLQLYRVAHNMWKDNDLKMAENTTSVFAPNTAVSFITKSCCLRT